MIDLPLMISSIYFKVTEAEICCKAKQKTYV